MKKKLIVLLGANQVLCDRANLLNIPYLLVTNHNHYSSELSNIAPNCILSDEPYSKHTIDLILDNHKSTNYSYVLSITEQGLLPAAQLNDLLGIASTSVKTVNSIKNKYNMRSKLKNTEYGNVVFCKITSYNDALIFSKKTNYPIILKPIEGVGSKNIQVINNKEDIYKLDKDFFLLDLIAEQYIEGEEYSIETFSFSGQHVIYAVTKKDIANEEYDGSNIEIGHQMPANIDISMPFLNEYISNFLNIMGINDGLAHTEIKVNNGEVYIIETHNRNGGDNIPNLVRLTTGHDLYENALKWPLGLMNKPQKPIKHFQGAAIRYFNLPPYKIVKSISGLVKYNYEPNVIEIKLNLKPGDITPVIKSSSDRVGYVICTGKTANEAMSKCKKIISNIKIDYN